MRVLMKVSIPTDAGNARAVDGSLGRLIESILADQKPEAAYFIEDGGKRTGMVVLDIKDVSEIPRVAEPYFLAFKASVEIHPAMTIEDLRKAGDGIAQAVAKYGNAATL